MQSAPELRAMAAAERAKANDSFERCDTDGIVSQRCLALTAAKLDAEAAIIERGGLAEFRGLYQGDRRLAARVINTQYGPCWLLRDDEQAIFGRQFVPIGGRSRIQKQLGIAERPEFAPAETAYAGNGRGLSGLATCHVAVVRTGDSWGLDATLKL